MLEALTEIPFPANDNLCTRFSTEVILRRGLQDSLTIKIIPDNDRPASEKAEIQTFRTTITDFSQLPDIMEQAMLVMGLRTVGPSQTDSRAFTKDVLSIEIEGPTRPQLTVVDLPGLIQTETKGVTAADIKIVTDITDRYIAQPRTICLAVISASNDYANQPVLTRVRAVDPKGKRTLGVITKPDLLPPGSGSEQAFLALARNEDIFFELGWHVIRNRKYDENSFSFLERNATEATYFRTSNFKTLPQEFLGIEALRDRLSMLLFEHVRQALPRLREDLRARLHETRLRLDMMGSSRATAQDCKAYLTQFSLAYYEICKAAMEGHYEGDYFNRGGETAFSSKSKTSIRRLRAVIQLMNTEFSENLRSKGHKYQIERSNPKALNQDEKISQKLAFADGDNDGDNDQFEAANELEPIKMSSSEAIDWVGQVLVRTRGKELPGNFNPLIVSELFWEQSAKWYSFAKDHVEKVANVCSQFLEVLLQEKCPKDIRPRLWSLHIQEALKRRSDASLSELQRLAEELKDHPINYNHYYTDTITKLRQERWSKTLASSIEAATTHTYLPNCNSDHTSASINVDSVINAQLQNAKPDMGAYSCEEALDCLFAIYKVSTYKLN